MAHNTDRQGDMATEVWFRNPHDYIRELVEVGQTNIAWDRGLLHKRGIDPIKHAELYIGKTYPYRILTVGTQGTAEYQPGDTLETPSAVYPTWAYGEDSTILENMLEHPYGEDEETCSDLTVPGDERPVWGQEHRVVITDVPHTAHGPGRQFIRYLRGLQEAFPKAIIHLHGVYGWKVAFGMSFGAADVEPRSAAQKGRVHLPSGETVMYERVINKPQWAANLGFTPIELKDPKNRCKFNIKSAVWAGRFYEEMFKFRTRSSGAEVDHESSDNDFTPEETKGYMSTAVKIKDGDQQLCDTCSLQNTCKYFRQGAVCTVPGAEPVKLSRMFKTRDADTIIDGLGLLLQSNANRLERGLGYESIDGEIDPEVTKMVGQVFDQGVKLAKMLDPARFSPGARVQVNVGQGGTASLSAGNPRQLVAQVIRELEQQGVPRDKITPDMVQGVLEGMVDPDNKQKAVEGTVISER